MRPFVSAQGFLLEKARASRARSDYDITVEEARRARRARRSEARFGSALRHGANVCLIAEFKRRSPSAGGLTAATPEAVALDYASAGANALSVLTDATDFGGSLDDLQAIADATSLPVLRKDFIVDERDIAIAVRRGADAVLLIVAMLDDVELRHLIAVATELDMTAVVEVHTLGELDRALHAGGRVVGINNRSLTTLAVDLGTTERLAPLVPHGVTVVSESGIRTAADVARMRDAGAHAVLVGESLLRLDTGARSARVAEMSAVPR